VTSDVPLAESQRHPSLRANGVTRSPEVLNGRWKSLAPGLLILLLTVAAYLPVLRCGFIWDDNDYVTGNQTLRELHGLYRIWFEPGAVPQYYPLVHTTFWLEYHCWGLNPLGYHLVNLLLHALAAILLWRTLLRLQLPGAWLAAAVFAVHPLGVESVAWITERKNVLSGVFYFGAALAYLRFQALGDARTSDHRVPSGGKPQHRWPWYLGALTLFVLAMLSKTVACSLPAAILLVRWWQEGELRGKDILPLAPFFAIGAGLGLLTVHLEIHQVGAHGAAWSLTALQRCLIAGRALWFYAWKLVVPVKLTFIYPRWEVSPRIWWQWLFPAAALAVVAALWLYRRQFGRGPLVGVLFFAGTLLPALGFVNVYPMRYSFVADHFQYLAGVGLVVLVAVATARLPRKTQWALVALPLLLGALTWQQIKMYKDLESLWQTTVARNPEAFLAHNNLAVILRARGQLDEAIFHLQKTLEIQPGFAEAHNNLGNALRQRGQTDLAITHFETALQLEPNNAPAYGNLGSALLDKGQANEAIAQFRKALQLEPGNVELLNNLAYALLSIGRGNEAIALFKKAIELRPYFVDAHNNLGNLLLQMGQVDEAIACYRKALEIQPDHAPAHSNLGRALLQKRDLNDAISYFASAAQLSPNSAEAENELAGALLQGGRLDEARAHLRKAIEVRPSFAEAHNNLALTLLRAGKVDEAITQFQEALTLQPNNAPAHNHLGHVFLKIGRVQEAIDHYQAALALLPNDAYTLNNLAWVLATNPEASARNGARAVELAHRADQLSASSSPSILGTLAAAYAEAGRFADAVASAQRALELASAQTNSAPLPALKARIRLYQAGSPFRDIASSARD
jgi:protein O-mannosyl-transferase